MESIARRSSLCSNPPLQETYKTLFEKSQQHSSADSHSGLATGAAKTELPVIDLGPLVEGRELGKVAECKREIVKASEEWGFFQVVNHGIASHVLEKVRMEQEALFGRPFEEKKTCMEVAGGSYRWGASTATFLSQLNWSEAFHIPISYLLTTSEASSKNHLRWMEEYAGKVTDLANKLIKALAEELGRDSTFFNQNCNPSTSFLRLNKYPPCPATSMHGLVPHTDTDFLTVLHQDGVGGLQVKKDGEWISVKPNPNALIVNIGDLFQAWSNNVCKSVEHRVVTNQQFERYSVAYFMCPFPETVIKSEGKQHQVYRRFSFREYRDQVDEDVRRHGNKVGLARFLASN
uniref:Fe2OG dioxygenase domain-containing protein n=1 Tax=Kalanchoe fedtschenkoi TaxID=63787 RepID=A0A7N0RF48_KALFE